MFKEYAIEKISQNILHFLTRFDAVNGFPFKSLDKSLKIGLTEKQLTR